MVVLDILDRFKLYGNLFDSAFGLIARVKQRYKGFSDTIELIRGMQFLNMYENDPEDDDFDDHENLPPLLTDNQSAIDV